MPLSVTCPGCAARVRLPDGSAGRRFRCPKCQAIFQGPAAGPPPDDFGFAGGPAEEGPLPISAAARRATAEPYNPFADDSGADEDDERPRGKRHWKPKDDYNPFAEPPAGPAGGGGADPGQVFDFGAPDPDAGPPPPAGGLDFGPPGPPDPRPRRRRP